MGRTGWFGTTIVDPPWPYQNTSRHAKLSGYSDVEYAAMTMEDLKVLPVGDVTSNILLLWATGALIPDAVELVKAWGFEYKTMMFWHKATRPPLENLDGERVYRPAYGVGYWVRGDTEPVIIAKKPGTPSYRTNERATFIEQRGKHSEKPPNLHRLAEKHFPGPYLELFARRQTPNWVCLGDGVEEGRDIGDSLEALAKWKRPDASA
jgi:N6-adenosine-specific RNA methylase IME4